MLLFLHLQHLEVKLAKLEELRLTKRGKFRLIVNEIPKENNHE